MSTIINIGLSICLLLTVKTTSMFNYETLHKVVYILTIFSIVADGLLRVERHIKLKISEKCLFVASYTLLWNSILCINILFDWVDPSTFCLINNLYMWVPGLICFALYLYIKKEFPYKNKLSAYTASYLIFQIIHLVLISLCYVMGCVCSFLFPSNLPFITYILIILLILVALADFWTDIRSQHWFYKKTFIEKIQLMVYTNDFKLLVTPKKSFLIFINVFLDTFFIRRFGFYHMSNILFKQLIKSGKSLEGSKQLQETFENVIKINLMKRVDDYSYIPIFFIKLKRILENKLFFKKQKHN